MPTLSITFCPSAFWSSSLINRTSKVDEKVKSTSTCFHLAHLINDPGEKLSIEIVRLPDSVVLYDLEVDQLRPGTNLGMCMCLQGVTLLKNSTDDNDEGEDSYSPIVLFLLCAFESGSLLLIRNGIVVYCLQSVYPDQSIPIVTMTMGPPPSSFLQYSNPDSVDEGRGLFDRLICVGSPDLDEDFTKHDKSLQFVQLSVNLELDQYNMELVGIRRKSPKSSIQPKNEKTQCYCCRRGISSFSWRPDGKLIAVGYWNGQIDLIRVKSQQSAITDETTPIKFKCYHLGSLISVGMLNSGSLLGDWASITVNEPHGPNIDQKSKMIRALCFIGPDFHLISSIPAVQGSVGGLSLWDVNSKRN